MKYFEENGEVDRGLKALDQKFKLSAKEEAAVLTAINREIDGKVSASPRKTSHWTYYIASAVAIFLLAILVIPIFYTTNELTTSDLAGETFSITTVPIFQEEIDDPQRYHAIITIDFLERHVIRNSIYGEGTYELLEGELILHFSNVNESLHITFTDFKKSDKIFSKYSAIVGELEYEVVNSEAPSQLMNLVTKFIQGQPVEFMEK